MHRKEELLGALRFVIEFVEQNPPISLNLKVTPDTTINEIMYSAGLKAFLDYLKDHERKADNVFVRKPKDP